VDWEAISARGKDSEAEAFDFSIAVMSLIISFLFDIPFGSNEQISTFIDILVYLKLKRNI